MPQLSDEEYKQGYHILGSDVVNGAGKVIRSDSADTTATPIATKNPDAAPNQQANLPPAAGDQNTGDQSTSSIFNYQTAVRLALNEATATRKGGQMGAVSSITSGLPNNALSSVIDSINQGANLSAEGTYKSFVDSQNKALAIEQQNKQNTIDVMKSMAADGSFAELPDGAIIALAKSSGVDAATLLGWRQNIKSKNELIKQKAIADINATNAQAAAANPFGIYGPTNTGNTLGTPASNAGGNLPQRNNNPLNITYGAATKKWVDGGAATVETTADGRKFLKFKDAETGFKAATDLLFDSNVYQNLTIDEALKKWSGGAYGAEIAPFIQGKGITIGDIKDLPKVAQQLVQAMAKREGFYAATGPTNQANNTPGTDIKNNPAIGNLFQPKVVSTVIGNKYLDLSTITDDKQRNLASIWASQNGIKPISSQAEVQGIQNLNTARKDVNTLITTLNSLKTNPQNWVQKLYQGPINTLNAQLQVNGKLAAYNTLLNQVITDLQAGGSIQGERIGTTLLDSVRNTLPNASTDTVEKASESISNWIKLFDNKESSAFGQNSITETGSTDRVTVISPTGAVGTIPSSQLQDALSQGYKQK